MGLAERWAGEAAEGRTAFVLEGLPASEPITVRAVLARCADLVVATTLLLMASPLLLIGMVVVAMGDGLPLFFGHERVGRRGRLFRCWKLRTMRTDAEERLWADADLHRRYIENGFKLPNAEDPRLIPGGNLLRRMYLDELPQLWNVMRGDMALVGPRPIVPKELELFGPEAVRLLRRRPGVFGEWTSRGRDRPGYPERVRVEMEYLEDPSFLRTVRILAKSVSVVVRGQADEG